MSSLSWAQQLSYACRAESLQSGASQAEDAKSPRPEGTAITPLNDKFDLFDDSKKFTLYRQEAMYEASLSRQKSGSLGANVKSITS